MVNLDQGQNMLMQFASSLMSPLYVLSFPFWSQKVYKLEPGHNFEEEEEENLQKQSLRRGDINRLKCMYKQCQ